MIELARYAAANLRLRLQYGDAIDQIEAPLIAEDGRSAELRAWLRDGSSISLTYEIDEKAENHGTRKSESME